MSIGWFTVLASVKEVSDIFERFTERARQVVVLAQDEARKLKHNYIGTEHILLGLIREDEGLGSRVLEEFEVTGDKVRAYLVDKIGVGDEIHTGQLPFTPRAKKILELALREALSLGHNYIGTEHILLGLIREQGGAAYLYLESVGATSEKIRSSIIRMLSGPNARTIEPEEQIKRAVKSIRKGLQEAERGLNTLEALLEKDMPADPGESV